MSMNIIAETRIASEITFIKEKPVLLSGEIAINQEQNGIKIGDGVHSWDQLKYLETSQDVIDKWYAIATSTTNSRLITLPDINFAYSIISADSNSMVESVVDTIIKNKNYFELTEEAATENSENGVLVIWGKGVQDITFGTTENLAKKEYVSRLRWVRNDGSEAREYMLWDEYARDSIESAQEDLASINEKLQEINQNNNNVSELLQANLVNFLNSTSGYGLVAVPNSTVLGNPDQYFLNANNEWVKLGLTAQDIIMGDNDSTTIAVKFATIEDKLNSDEFTTRLTISTIKNNSIKNYVGTVTNTTAESIQYDSNVYISSGALYGAAWNDYAEARITSDYIQPGRTVVENGDDTLSIATDRLMLGGNIVSDTFGMLIGKSDNAQTPIALCGRVLAYPYEEIEEYYPGAPVCTGPNGTVSVMTKDEVLHYPECIIGYVSAIPSYENWNGVEVDGRIWIKVV